MEGAARKRRLQVEFDRFASIGGGEGCLKDGESVALKPGARHGGQSEQRQPQDALNDSGHVIGIDFDAVIGACVKGAAILEELREAVAVCGERAGGVVTKPAADGVKRTIEPDGDSVIDDEIPIARLDEGAAAEGDDARAARFDVRNMSLNDSGFHLTKADFAALFEDLGNLLSFASFNLGVDVDEGPADLVGERLSDGGLAACHEANEIKAWSALQLQRHL